MAPKGIAAKAGLVRRAIQKTLIGPLRYRRGDGYDAQRFWEHRFSRYGTSLRGAGHEGRTEEENRREYEAAAAIVTARLERARTAIKTARILEVGCGTGFYTQLLQSLGAVSYTGLDITDVLFEEHRARFPDFEFVRSDVTDEPLEGEYDIILMIDVAEHIVSDEAFRGAMSNIRSALAPDGLLLVGPFTPESRNHLFYVRFWSLDEARSALKGLQEIECTPFRDGLLLSLTK